MKHMWSEEEIASLIEEQSSGKVHLYRHRILEKLVDSFILEFVIIDTNETAYTETTLLSFLEENSSEAVPYSANGRLGTEHQIIGVFKNSNPAFPFGVAYIQDVNTIATMGYPSITFTDTIIQII